MTSASFARSLARMAALSAVTWFTVMAVQLVRAIFDVQSATPLPALHGAAFLAATYLMIRLLARRIAGDA